MSGEAKNNENPPPKKKPSPKNPGLLIVYTGDGKGKTTAALGMALRAVGYNWRICIVQFIKGSWKYGEMDGLKRLEPEVELNIAGEGFVGIMDDKLPLVEHQKAAQAALQLARKKIESDDYRLVILDEINIALDLKLISESDVKELLANKPRCLHLTLTGRNAPAFLIEKADLVTEMKEIKHPYQKGILAQKGIDF